MEDYNIHGWTALHEACYKGYLNAVNKILDYSKSTGKNLIEMRTNDDFKTTPLLIAALGGHMDIIELLCQNGANIFAQLNFRETHKHGIVEVAAIKQHIELLVFMFDKIPDTPKRIRNLMLSDIIDKESRASLGRTIETLSIDYPNMTAKLSKFKPETHANRATVLFRGHQMIAYKLFQEDDFGYCLANFLKLSESNVESISSAVISLVNVIHNDTIRLSFIENKGIHYLIQYMQKHKKLLNKSYRFYFYKIIFHKLSCKALTTHNSNNDEDQSDNIDKIMQSIKLSLDDDNSNEIGTNATEEDIFDNFVECSSIGQAFSALSKYDEFLNLINKDGSNEKIIKYIKLLFELNILKKLYDLSKLEYESASNFENENISLVNNTFGKYILFEQYIGGFIICLGNIVHTNKINKFFFANADLYELIMGFWKYVEIKSINHKQMLTEAFYSYYGFLKRIELIGFLSKENKQIPTQFTKSSINIDDDFERISSLKTKGTSKNRFSSDLIKNLQLSIIECIGKIFYNNFDLKKKYAYSYDDFNMSIMGELKLDDIFDWSIITNIFIKTLISYLDINISNDKELQYQVLLFLNMLTIGDLEMQNRVIHIRNAFNSGLVSSFRNLLRKSSPFYIRKQTLIAVWTLSGDKNYQKTLDRKCIIYKAVGAQKFVDVLFDADEELSFICLEALRSIANGPPYRDSSNQLIRILHDASKVQALPAIFRLFKSKNTELIFACLKTLTSLCVSLSYTVSEKNQNLVVKLNGLQVILEICTNMENSNKLKSEAYYCLSMICLKNSYVYQELSKLIETDQLIRNIMSLLKATSYVLDAKVIEKDKNQSFKNKVVNKIDDSNIDSKQVIDTLKCQLKSGLTLCSFSFQNDEFFRNIVTAVGKIDWRIFKNIIELLNAKLKKSVSEKNSEEYFEIQKMRCILGYQITILHNLIINTDEDPRAVGIKMMIDIIPYSTNTALRSISCDYLGRTVKFNVTLIESLLCVNSIELLANSTLEKNVDDVNLNVGNTEKGVAALTLGLLTSLNPEARRRLLKVARRFPKIMSELKQTNEILHLDLLNEWKHFMELRDLVENDFSLSDRSITKFKTANSFVSNSTDSNKKANKKFFQNVLV